MHTSLVEYIITILARSRHLPESSGKECPVIGPYMELMEETKECDHCDDFLFLLRSKNNIKDPSDSAWNGPSNHNHLPLSG